MADPATAGDPRDAQYWANLAKIGQGRDVEKAEGKGARERLAANTEYQVGKGAVGEGQIGKQEWPGYRNLRNQSNKQGLLRSGIQGERHGQLATQYAARRYAITHGRTEQEGAMERSEAANERRRKDQEAGELTSAQGRYKPVAPPTYGPAPSELGAAAQAELAIKPTPYAAAAAKRVGGRYGWTTEKSGRKIRTYYPS